MRITGFTGGGKKDVPPIFMLVRDEGDAVLGIGTVAAGNVKPWCKLKKYSHLIYYIETDIGITKFGDIPIPSDLEADSLFFEISGIGKFNISYYIDEDCVEVDSNTTEFDETVRLSLTNIDENGNYVSGSVFMLI